ncbi:SusC/RagA family TonB-linked outer membrane protein, partial [Persicitalea sp.]|uniref:SusC/RagA family TonB-linked outer membrane protein n=1 Tax=Persicitalea sp. TaxID=3100273 RepID=UPI003592FA4D
MKNSSTSQRLLYHVLKASILQLALAALFTGIALATTVNGQGILDRKVSLDVRNTALSKALRELEKSGQVKFSYNSRSLPLDEAVTVRAENEALASVLTRVLEPLKIHFMLVSNRIVLRNAVASKSVPQENSLFSHISIQAPADRTVTGSVTDENGSELPGVSVLVKGTQRGTTTDQNGAFTVSVPEGRPAILVFSYVGYLTQEVEAGNRSQINIALAVDSKALEEVVVVGYGTQKKANLTGAVSSVNFEDQGLASRSTTNVSGLLVGLAAGVRIQQTSGIPKQNNNASISIRGVGSLNASQAPLVIIDGMIADINSVSPNDVASVSILKDAASASIYGSRASNGVILIKTKSGMNADGKVSFTYNNFVGSRSPTIMHDVISNTADHMALINTVVENSGFKPQFTQAQIDEWREKSQTDPIGYPNTDWSKAIIKKNTVMNHNFSARGGNEKVNFYSSVDFFKDDGLIPNTSFRRFNFRNNLSYKVNKWLTLGNNLTFINTKSDPAEIGNIFNNWRTTSPGVLPKHPDGRYGAAQTPSGETGANNPLMRAEERRGENNSNVVQGKLFATVSPLKGLSVTASYFMNLVQDTEWGGVEPFDRWDFQRNIIALPNNNNRLSLSNSYAKYQRQIIDVFGNYDLTLGKHYLKFLAGYNQEYYYQSNFEASRRDLLSYDTPVLNAASSEPQASGSASDYAIRSYFGRVNYAFESKYLLEANIRYDGSSRFAPDARWGFFPSVSAGWQISEEDFWTPLRNTVTMFKLRASYGQLGNNGIGNYEWQNFYQAANYTLNESVVQGLAYRNFGNPNITWETTNVLNVGADIRLFRSLTLDLNYYHKTTSNILANLPIPNINGGIGAPRFNSAKVLNSGFEAEVRYTKSIRKLGVTAGFNFAYNKNRILEYKGDFIEPRGTAQAWTEGQPIGAYWVREVDRIVQDQGEVDALVGQGYVFKPSTPGPGDFLYRDQNGDKVIDDKDRILKGNPIPHITYG